MAAEHRVFAETEVLVDVMDENDESARARLKDFLTGELNQYARQLTHLLELVVDERLRR